MRDVFCVLVLPKGNLSVAAEFQKARDRRRRWKARRLLNRQARWEARQIVRGLCRKCADPTDGSIYCTKHRLWNNAYQRKRRAAKTCG